ncbi:FAD-binding protein [Galactobacter valiniphilus]|uniref:FAD-binding protein n=1 Tax=Galactobacter valiniphilus TaxID=2676122 RepID=A0A399JCE4_9MICC|nr:FAD-linked oxidase C-terminal domain-containing protein [Galactobacter valiniphilus]RII42904.1 FAD-binding protein [Galactobacter valiniphilus]
MTQPASPATPDASPDAAALEALHAALPGRVSTDPELLRERSLDRSGQRVPGLPTAVILAASVEDVQAACRVAHAHGVPLVTRGAGTGLAGGALAGTGELVLDLSGLTEVLEINAANRLAVVQAGVINAELNARLAEHGLWWAPDPASKAISTVGGNIAMNAGGLLCAKYGVTREAVLGLKVVLADGSVIETGHRTVKGVTGYDVTALMIGSEGTLGVIVEATLKLLTAVTGPTPTLGAAFGSLEEAARAVADVSEAGLVPAAMELLDRPSLDALAAHTGTDAAPGAQAYLLVQTDGVAGAPELEAIAAILSRHGAACSVAADQDEAHKLFALRRELFPSLEGLGGTLLVEDVAVPKDRLAEAFAGIREIEARFGLSIPTAAHAGDGNLHPTFVVPGDEVPEVVWEAASELFALGLALGGTLSGEHGIGLLKRRWLRDELGETQHELQRGIKALFDPRGILNPGKVF